MRLTEARPGARVLAFGGYQPARVVTNDELAADRGHQRRVDPQPGRDRQPADRRARTRPWPTWPSPRAARRWPASGLSAADIDLVIVATCTPEVPIPNTAATVARRLGIAAPGAYDLNAACAGLLLRARGASDAVRAGHGQARAGDRRREAVPVGGLDRPVHLHHLRRRRGRRGGRPGRPTREDGPGIGPVVWGSDGDMADKICIKDRDSFIVQEGQAVFRWATTALHPVAKKACERAGVDPTELAAFVPHQANLRIIEAHRPQARRAAGAGRRRHRARRQHLVRVDPAGPVPDDRARRARLRRHRRCCSASARASATPRR